MTTSISEKDGKLIATLEGSLDTAVSERVAHELQPLYDCEGRDIVIDCQQLKYISSSGLRILLGIRKRASVVGSNVTLTHVTNDISFVLQTTGFNNLFAIE